MPTGWLFLTVFGWAAATAGAQQAQVGPQRGAPAHVCACGAHPPGPSKDRVAAPYAAEPADMSPYSKFATPYDLNYTHPNIYSGAGRDLPEPENITEVRIGFFGPIEHTPDEQFGQRMLHGAQLAVDEANARGGYGGKPFRLMLHNDYDNWQAKASYGEDRATDPTIWGSASNEVVKMVYDDDDWAIFGSISSESTHIALRVALRAEIPIINSASTDPTIPETYVPWYFTVIQDDRVQTLTLARRIFTGLGLKRVAILRVNNRYGRFGVPKLRDAARRLGHPIVIEQKFLPGDIDFTRQLKVIQGSRADAIVLWTDEIPAAQILKQMRALGMKQRVFGSYRTLGPDLLAEAGPAAEGFEAVFPYDPTRTDPRWLAFNDRFDERFHSKPGQFSALAYDAMNALLDSICSAGLNRARIHDALADMETYDGVTGTMAFDPNQKNVSPMYIGTVRNGSIVYRVASMEKSAPSPSASTIPNPVPYARVGEDGVAYNGPALPDTGADLSVILFGPDALTIAKSAAFHQSLDKSAEVWRVLPIASNQGWGAASTQLVAAIMDRKPLAIIALDRDAAHLAEQLALKAFIPVIAISDDRSLTATNVPWIFRMPSTTPPTSALQLLVEAERRTGPNPQRLRDLLASGIPIAGTAFASAGEPMVR